MKEQLLRLKMAQFSEVLAPRAADAHKGNFGHVLIVGGDHGFSGAPILSAMAALRVGAGLVSVATRAAHAAIMNAAHPEIMCHGIETTQALRDLLEKATVMVIGPGLGQSSWSKTMWTLVLKNKKKPMVMDADALNGLAKSPKKQNNWILTPHPGEAGRLLGCTVAEVQSDRPKSIKTLQKQYGGVCVLKGQGTLVLGEKGIVAVCPAGNPGLATAGTGDVLSGVIGGLLAQGISLEVAAQCGVLAHAQAADSAAGKAPRGMMASDLLPHLRHQVNL